MQLTQVERRRLDAFESQNVIRGDNDWRGDCMHEKMNNVGMRVITTNVAKKLLTVVDAVPKTPKEGPGTRNITYLEYMIEYMREMQGDVMIMHEPPSTWPRRGGKTRAGPTNGSGPKKSNHKYLEN